jgi:threonine dehydratase
MVIARADIAEARQRLDSRLRATPVLDVPVAELVGGGEGTLSLKLEFLQHSGTFKARGAMHRMLVAETGLSDGPRRVVAASGGNHGAAVAWAARELGWDATIFVPTIASPAKVERLVSYGARVEQVGAMFSEAHDASQQHVAQQVVAPLTIHPYDDPIAVAGAGTCAAEWSEQSAPLDTVWVACGGGGLAAGTSAWFGSGVDMRDAHDADVRYSTSRWSPRRRQRVWRRSRCPRRHPPRCRRVGPALRGGGAERGG